MGKMCDKNMLQSNYGNNKCFWDIVREKKILNIFKRWIYAKEALFPWKEKE